MEHVAFLAGLVIGGLIGGSSVAIIMFNRQVEMHRKHYEDWMEMSERWQTLRKQILDNQYPHPILGTSNLKGPNDGRD